jgi:hypothetical protein
MKIQTAQNYDINKVLLKEPLIYMLDKFDLTTNSTEIARAKKLWKQGKSIYEIAEELRPTVRGITETFLLLLHMVESGIIKPREGYMWGNMIGEM